MASFPRTCFFSIVVLNKKVKFLVFCYFISNVASEIQLIFLRYAGLILCLVFGLLWFFSKNWDLLLVNSVPLTQLKMFSRLFLLK